MSGESFALFPTELGDCAIVWNDNGVIRTRLPSRTKAELNASVEREFPGATETAPPPEIAAAIEKIAAAITGEPTDFSQVKIDAPNFGEFQRLVYEVTQAIPPGSTLTYGEVAKRAGDPGAAQAVGQTLGANRFPVIIPCHRVIGADGKMIGFSATGGVDTKRKLLEIEGAFALDKLPLFGGEQ